MVLFTVCPTEATNLKSYGVNLTSIKVKCFATEKSGFLVHTDPEIRYELFNYSPGWKLGAEGTKLGSNIQLSKLLLRV